MGRILSAAIATKAEAIHPGFGFLSENSKFVEMCEKCNVTFIGPSAAVINKMGNKSEARRTMMEAGVPVVPGTKEPVYTVEEALKEAEKIGFPIMIKASSGGGGKGMRISESREDLKKISVRPRGSLSMHLLTIPCIWNVTWAGRATSKYRSSQTGSVRWYS